MSKNQLTEFSINYNEHFKNVEYFQRYLHLIHNIIE